jgi:hypothetical protein
MVGELADAVTLTGGAGIAVARLKGGSSRSTTSADWSPHKERL